MQADRVWAWALQLVSLMAYQLWAGVQAQGWVLLCWPQNALDMLQIVANMGSDCINHWNGLCTPQLHSCVANSVELTVVAALAENSLQDFRAIGR